jgi:hypothetical protein
MYVKLECYVGGFDTIFISPSGDIKITQPPQRDLIFILWLQEWYINITKWCNINNLLWNKRKIKEHLPLKNSGRSSTRSLCNLDELRYIKNLYGGVPSPPNGGTGLQGGDSHAHWFIYPCINILKLSNTKSPLLRSPDLSIKI